MSVCAVVDTYMCVLVDIHMYAYAHAFSHMEDKRRHWVSGSITLSPTPMSQGLSLCLEQGGGANKPPSYLLSIDLGL